MLVGLFNYKLCNQQAYAYEKEEQNPDFVRL